MINFELENNFFSLIKENNLLKSIKNYIDKKAPHGKIVIFFSEKFDFNFAYNLGEQLSNNNKVVYYLKSEKEPFSIDNLCHLFNLHEDIRLSISLDSNSIKTATYFSVVRHIPLIYITNNFEVDQVNNSLLIKNGEEIDIINTNINKYVIINKPFCNLKAEIFAYLVDKAFSIFDYYITSLFTNSHFLQGKANELLLSIENAKTLLIENYAFSKEKILEEIIKINNINVQNRKVFFNSATNFFEILSNKNVANGKKMYIDCLILHYFKKALYLEDSIFPPSYNELAEKMAKLLGIKNSQPLFEIKKQIKLFNSLNNSILGKIDAYIKQCEKFLIASKKEYLRLGGKVCKITIKEKEILKSSGDFLSLNILSAIRETYLIKK